MRNIDRQVVVTGASVICNMGSDLSTITRDLRSGRPGVFKPWGPALELQSGCSLAGVIEGDYPVEKQLGRFMGRAARMAWRATQIALEESGLERRDLAVVIGSGTGDVATHREVYEKLERSRSTRRLSPTVVPRMMASTVSANVATNLRTTGPSFSLTAACASGAYNILMAAELIEHGHVDAAVAGGVEIADVHFYAGFDAMRAYNGQDNHAPGRASRPYAADRAGFIFGEAVGIVVLETRAAAEARGATIQGVLRGYGMSSDGTGDMVFPSSDGAYEAMKRALRHAGISPDEIGYVNTHGTSTPSGDVSEVKAIRRLLDGRPVRYSSTKCYTGHSIAAAGAIEAIFTLAMLRGGWVAPAVNALPLDPQLVEYPPVLEPLDCSFDLALSNSLGFGGTNVSLVLGRA